uniref:Methyltransferase type 12 domain-containing protein n=1 Tax=Leptobrachium leishanense TaxID=445787 RepID=A0A8C5PIG2_9ANUR
MASLLTRGCPRVIYFRCRQGSVCDWLFFSSPRLLGVVDWQLPRAFHISAASGMEGKRPQFGNRLLNDPSKVFQHNAWDNVQWSEDQEAVARKKVEENSCQPVPPEKQEEYENKASSFWDDFYTIHENKFFKDRHWLFTEFPELYSQVKTGDGVEGGLEAGNLNVHLHGSPVNTVTSQRIGDEEEEAYPGVSATYRILEVGCGVGNTVFPILQNNVDPGLFVYGCDFSSTAVELVKGNENYDPYRCFAFVHDLSDVHASYPMPEESLDVIVMIFVLSAIQPSKMQSAISQLSKLLKPGGCILLRDYGRYDMAQLRFKKGRCLSENFYVRGDGTRVYFFTQADNTAQALTIDEWGDTEMSLETSSQPLVWRRCRT